MADAFSTVGTFRAYQEMRRSPSWLSAPISRGFFGVLVGRVGDEALEAWTISCRMSLLLDTESPEDVLPIIGQDRRLQRYPLETTLQYRERLFLAWDDYAIGGTEYAIELQLRKAGFGPANTIQTWGQSNITFGQSTPVYYWGNLGAYVQYRPDAKGPKGEPAPYRTQFWIVFRHGFHPVEDDMIPWGTFEWGDSEPGVWSYIGYSDDFARTVMSIVYKWKDSTYLFRGFVFKFGGISVWAEPGHTWAEANNKWGNSIEYEIESGAPF